MATPLTDDALRKYGASRNFLPQVSALCFHDVALFLRLGGSLTARRCARQEEDEQGPVVVTALDFHAQGELCVAARNDGVLSLINCLSGT